MDLAKYYFLGGIVSKMQDDKDRNAQEILNHQDLIWEADDFEGRYGYQYSSLCEDLQHMYGKCRAAASAVLIRHKLASSVQDYKIRTLVSHSSGGPQCQSRGCGRQNPNS